MSIVSATSADADALHQLHAHASSNVHAGSRQETPHDAGFPLISQPQQQRREEAAAAAAAAADVRSGDGDKSDDDEGAFLSRKRSSSSSSSSKASSAAVAAADAFGGQKESALRFVARCRRSFWLHALRDVSESIQTLLVPWQPPLPTASSVSAFSVCCLCRCSFFLSFVPHFLLVCRRARGLGGAARHARPCC